MIERTKKILLNPYILITITYVLGHVFLLILSGCWWDDWTFMTHDLTYVNMVASQSGRPEWNILIPFCWALPNNGRIIIFFLYYLISVFLYIALKESKLLDENQSLIITLLFTIIPVNDARLLISNFPYTVGLFIFYLSLVLFIKWNNGKKKIIYRLVILLLFFVSFILNSLLAFYYTIFVYLFILDFINSKEKSLIKKITISIKTVIIKYLDFFILPLIYFIGNKLLFPITEEGFEVRSSITIEGIIKCFKYLPLSILNIFKDIYIKMFECLTYWPVIVVCLIVIGLLLIYVKNNKQEKNVKENLIYIVFGLIILSLALFAYVEIRGNIISTTGVKGRDSILVPLGIAIIIVSIYSLLKNKYKTILCVITILLCTLSFNLLYIEWQKDYYCQLSMKNLLDNEIIKNNDTFFLANLDETDIEGERYYSLNTNAYHVYNDETRFFIPKVSNLYMLESKESIEEAKTILNGSQMMKDYNPDDYCLDAILIYENDLSWQDVLKLKYYELTDIDKFNNLINNTGSMKIVEVDDEFTTKLLKEYHNNNLNNDMDVVELLEVYYN